MRNYNEEINQVLNLTLKQQEMLKIEFSLDEFRISEKKRDNLIRGLDFSTLSPKQIEKLHAILNLHQENLNLLNIEQKKMANYTAKIKKGILGVMSYRDNSNN